MKNYNLPKTKAEKVELLKAIFKGEKSITDIMDPTYKITMWRQDDENPLWMQTFDGTQRMSKEDFEARKRNDGATHVTLEL